MYRTNKKEELTNMTCELIAYDMIKKSFDAMAKRADRKLKPLAANIYDRLEEGGKLARGDVVAQTRFMDYKRARVMVEGINEFKNRFPQYGGEILQVLIDKTRDAKRGYLVFGLKNGGALPQEMYLDMLENIGVGNSVVKRTLQTVWDISDVLAEKKRQGLEEMLIK